MKILILTVLAFVSLGCLPGCSATAMPKEFAKVTQSIALSMLDQAIWDELVGNVDGQVIVPGVRVAAGIMYVAEAQLTGVSGAVRLSGEGHGVQEPSSAEIRAALIALLGDQPELVDKILKAIEDGLPASEEE